MKNRVHFIKEIIGLLKIKKEMKAKKIDTEKYLSESKKSSNFNNSNLFYGNEQLEDFYTNDILYCYLCMKYSYSKKNKAFYANTLVRLLGSFLDFYAQTLNNFYDLELVPLRKEIKPSIIGDGIVAQAIKGVGNSNNQYKPVTLTEVRKKINQDYDTNEYYEKIEKILDDSNIIAMNILRNYETHFQSIFSNISQSYSFDGKGSSHKVIFLSGSTYKTEEFDKFTTLSENIIDLYRDLIFNFNKMVFDKKLVPKNKNQEEVFIFQCPKCLQKFNFTELQKVTINYDLKFTLNHENCHSNEFLIWTGEKMMVHPEKYEQMLLNEVESTKKGELKVFDSEGNQVILN